MKKSLLQLLLIASVSTQAQIPNYIPTNGLIAWYPFNGTVLDESGNSNHGVNNGATLTSDRDNNANSAYHFDGASTISANFSVTNPINAYTISTWFKITSVMQLGGLGMRPNLTQPSPSLYGFSMSTNFNEVWSNHYDNGNMVQNVAIYNVNSWQHVVMTFDGDKMRLYINGAKIDSSTQLQNMPPATNFNFLIGNWITPDVQLLDNFYKGDLDDIAIWDRALDSSEVSYLNLAMTTGLETVANQSQLSIAPNPTEGVFYLTNISNPTEYIITNVVGKAIVKGCTDNTEHYKIDLTNYAPGVYYLTTNETPKRTLKVIKGH